MPPTFRPTGRLSSRSEAAAAHDQDRSAAQPWRAWYKTARWQRLRVGQLTAEPLCRRCIAQGMVEPATVCDHVEPHKGDEAKFWSGPFQSLCASCHNSAKQKAERRARKAEPYVPTWRRC